MVLFGILLLDPSCKKLCVPASYSFRINNCMIQPDKDSINIGDTLYFNSVFSTTMINLTDGKNIDYSSADNMGDILGVGELIGQNTISDAVKYFSYIPMVGKIYTDSSVDPFRVKQTSYSEENGYYILKFGIVPQKSGIYIFSIADMPDVVRKCARSSIIMQFSSSINNHLYYLKDIYYGGGPIIYSGDPTHTYSFKVK